MLLSTIACNLKQFLKQQPKQQPSVAVARYSGQPRRGHHLFNTRLPDFEHLRVRFLAARIPGRSSATATGVTRKV
jgi:hypothetical protein